MTDHPGGGAGRGPVTLEELIALRDGDLPPDQQAALLERIDTDPGAARLLAELDDTNAILDRIRAQPAPPGLTEAIEARLAAEPAPYRPDAGDPGDPPSEPGDAATLPRDDPDPS